MDTAMQEMEETILMGAEDYDFFLQMEQEELVLMGAEDLNVQLLSELKAQDAEPEEDPVPAEDAEGGDPGAAGPVDDSHLWEYADRTEKTEWQNRTALLIALAQMERYNELDRLLTKFGEHQNIQQQLVFLRSAIQRYGDRGPKMLGYKW